MKANRVRGVLLTIGLGLGVASAACHDARSKADAPNKPPTGGAISNGDLLVNRPYLLAIVDQPTGALLMLGHIEEPQ